LRIEKKNQTKKKKVEGGLRTREGKKLANPLPERERQKKERPTVSALGCFSIKTKKRDTRPKLTGRLGRIPSAHISL